MLIAVGKRRQVWAKSRKNKLIGDVIGGYRLDKVIGRGGMGSVFKATHSRLGRTAAVKVLSESLSADQEFVSRFFHEAKIVNDVHHKNIVDIVDFIEDKELSRVAYVMELIEGPSLSEALKEHPFTLEQTLNVIDQIAAAMAAVHKIGVIHRDLKPSNILLVSSPKRKFSAKASVKVLDFGIAKSMGDHVSHKTAAGAILGTPAYMAPEQVSAGHVSRAADVFAVGEIFFEMLTGKKLFKGENMAILRAKAMGEIPAVSLPEDLLARKELESIITACLFSDPEKRPSVMELRKSLNTIRKKIGLEPRPASRAAESIAPDSIETEALTMNTSFVSGYSFSDIRSFSSQVTQTPGARLFGGLSLLAVVIVIGSNVWLSQKTFSIVGSPLGGAAVGQSSNTIDPKPNEQEPKAPKLVSIAVITHPEHAEVYDASTKMIIGIAPLVLRVKQAQTKALLIKADGHHDREVEIDTLQAIRTVRLERVKKKRSTRRRNKKYQDKKEAASASNPETKSESKTAVKTKPKPTTAPDSKPVSKEYMEAHKEWEKAAKEFLRTADED